MPRRSRPPTVTDPGPSPDEWRPLFGVAARVLETQPWRQVDEATVFGVQDPGSGQVNYVSVMGRLGEHHAVALYLGAAGLHGFLDMHWKGERRVDAETVLTIPQLQLVFGTRRELLPAELAALRQQGWPFSGTYPMFRSCVPGYVPRPLSSAQIPVLCRAVELTVAVAPDLVNDPTDTKPTTIPVFVPTPDPPRGWNWRRELRPLPPPPPEPPLGMIPPDLVAAVAALPAQDWVLNGGVSLQLLPIRAPGIPPYYASVLQLVEPLSGMILGGEVLAPLPDLAAVRTAAPAALARLLIAARGRPAELRLAEFWLAAACRSLAASAGIAVTHVPVLPALIDAQLRLREYICEHPP